MIQEKTKTKPREKVKPMLFEKRGELIETSSSLGQGLP
jgi:hypothetical protein